jgi:ubiquinone biosynthesis protein UbiJ
LHHRPASGEERVQLTLNLPVGKLRDFVADPETVKAIVGSKEVKSSGDIAVLELFASLITNFNPDWDIVTKQKT